MKVSEMTNEELLETFYQADDLSDPDYAQLKAELLRRLNAEPAAKLYANQCEILDEAPTEWPGKQQPPGGPSQSIDELRAKHMFMEDTWIEEKASQEDGCDVRAGKRYPGEPAKPCCPKCGDRELIFINNPLGSSVRCAGNITQRVHYTEIKTPNDFAQFFPAERQEGWVSAEQELPKDSVCVLFYTNEGHIESGWYRKEDAEWCCERTAPQDEPITFKQMDGQVTHWRPLPAPPSAPAEPIAQKGLMAMQKNLVDKPVSDDV